MIMLGLTDETQFASILTWMSVSGVIIMLACAFVISDAEDAEGGGGFSLSAMRDKA